MSSTQSHSHRLISALWLGLVLLGFFLFRLFFGLCSEFWADDEKQIYLIGLKYFTTHAWPYFGPTAYKAQIPGALQGLTIGVPLFIWPIPEAPFILLNLLSFSGLCLFTWYCSKRLPKVPLWFMGTWLFTSPWTLNFSTHIVNPSYVLFGSCLFFIGFLETIPTLGLNLVPLWLCNLLMSFSFFWIIQFHLSGVVLAPFILLSCFFQFRSDKVIFFKSILWLLVGAIPSGIFLLPTFLKFGFSNGAGHTGTLLKLNLDNIKSFFTILFRFLSLSSFELPRFIGANTASRLAFFQSELWIVPFGLFLLLAGWIQPLLMLFQSFLKKNPKADWKAVWLLVFGSVFFIYVSFWFTSKEPAAHTFYLFLPLAMLYSFYCLEDWLQEKRWRTLAKIFLVCGLIYNIGLALNRLPTHSLYKNRDIVVLAIAQNNYHLLGEKLSDSW
jgi:hypothetical protein